MLNVIYFFIKDKKILLIVLIMWFLGILILYLKRSKFIYKLSFLIFYIVKYEY